MIQFPNGIDLVENWKVWVGTKEMNSNKRAIINFRKKLRKQINIVYYKAWPALQKSHPIMASARLEVQDVVNLIRFRSR